MRPHRIASRLWSCHYLHLRLLHPCWHLNCMDPASQGTWAPLALQVLCCPFGTGRSFAHPQKLSCGYLTFTSHSWLVFSARIHLLTTHMFTGGYSTRFKSHSNDPLHHPCRELPQTAHHIVVACPLYATEGKDSNSPSSTCSILLAHEKEGKCWVCLL
jgi:hypothetical protein